MLAEHTATLYLSHLDRKVAVLIPGRSWRESWEDRDNLHGLHRDRGVELMIRLGAGVSGWGFSIFDLEGVSIRQLPPRGELRRRGLGDVR